jgi:hypothetical protein
LIKNYKCCNLWFIEEPAIKNPRIKVFVSPINKFGSMMQHHSSIMFVIVNGVLTSTNKQSFQEKIKLSVYNPSLFSKEDW